jgi:hypothetical protein
MVKYQTWYVAASARQFAKLRSVIHLESRKPLALK